MPVIDARQSSRAARFARAIHARHGVGRDGRRAALSFRRALGVLVHRVARHLHVHVAPRVFVRAAETPRHAGAAPRVGAAGPSAPADRRAPRATIVRASSSPLRSVPGPSAVDVALLHRLEARLARIESVSSPSVGTRATRDSAAGPRAGLDPRAVPPVPRVLQRAAPATVVAPEPEPALAGWGVPIGRAPRSTPRASGTDFSAAEVNRLADRVMQSLDQRILAHRERRGRV
jgi:hypothetical protein